MIKNWLIAALAPILLLAAAPALATDGPVDAAGTRYQATDVAAPGSITNQKSRWPHVYCTNCTSGGAAADPITPKVSASSAATSLIAKATPGNYADAYCQSSVTGRCIVYNATTVPGAGALTPANVLECFVVPAGGTGSVSYSSGQRVASAGIVVLFSSSADCNTYTASPTAYIHASVI